MVKINLKKNEKTLSCTQDGMGYVTIYRCEAKCLRETASKEQVCCNGTKQNFMCHI